MTEKVQKPVKDNKKAAPTQQTVDYSAGDSANADFSTKVFSLKSMEAFADNSRSARGITKQASMAEASNQSRKTTQLQAMADASSSARKIAQLQAMSNNRPTQQFSQQNPVQLKGNNTGLPDNLKSGIETLSGVSMDGVKVHKNSDKPAQLNAHAYAQGTDIHLGAGQEKHLPHEAWHVVQQSQGRVQPTTQMAGVNINDNSGLEKEADVMGAKALQTKSKGPDITQLKSSLDGSSDVAQMVPKWIKKLFSRSASSDRQSLLGGYSSLSDEGPDEDLEAPVAAAPAAPIEQEGAEIEAGPFKYKDGQITLDVWGQEITFGRGGLSGALPNKEFNMDIGNFEKSIDIPFAPGVYATVSLGIKPTLAFTIAGGTFAINPQEKSMTITEAGVTGSMGLEITAKAGVGAGLANVAGLEAGGFATLGGQAELGGKIGGIVDFTNRTSGVTLSLDANADIIGKAGVFVQAKVLMLSAEKKWILAEKTFAKFEYHKSATLTRNKGIWLTDINKGFTPMMFRDMNYLEGEDITQPLLGGSERSDAYSE